MTLDRPIALRVATLALFLLGVGHLLIDAWFLLSSGSIAARAPRVDPVEACLLLAVIAGGVGALWLDARQLVTVAILAGEETPATLRAAAIAVSLRLFFGATVAGGVGCAVRFAPDPHGFGLLFAVGLGAYWALAGIITIPCVALIAARRLAALASAPGDPPAI